MKPHVSIIIATKDEAISLPRLLTSLKRQTYKQIEIIVVDNFSTDKTRDIAKQFTQHIYSAGDERSQQRNVGAQKARGDYLLFLDADMELPPTIIAECVNVLLRNNGVAVIIPETNTAKKFFGRIKKLEKQLYRGEPTIEAARFFRSDVFRATGGYNENVIAGEDWDLSQRVAGIGLISQSKTALYHHESSLWRELRHKWYYAKNISAYARIHPKSYSLQSGMPRLGLFWRKKHLLISQPLTASGLIVIKGLEYILFIAARSLTRSPIRVPAKNP